MTKAKNRRSQSAGAVAEPGAATELARRARKSSERAAGAPRKERGHEARGTCLDVRRLRRVLSVHAEKIREDWQAGGMKTLHMRRRSSVRRAVLPSLPWVVRFLSGTKKKTTEHVKHAPASLSWLGSFLSFFSDSRG